MSYESREGKNFEKEIQKHLEKTHLHVFSEKEIRQAYSYITCIDHLIQYGNYVFCFQDKWSKNTISNSQINHFISGIGQLKEEYPNKIFIGIYISKNSLSKPAKDIINSNSRLQIYSIYNEDKTIIFNELSIFLHEFKIWTYDEHSDAIMI